MIKKVIIFSLLIIFFSTKAFCSVKTTDKLLVSHQNEPKINIKSTYAKLPKPLNQQDIKLYKEIFEIQKKGHWNKANKLINKLESKILLGHIMSQRYLHPNKYKSRYKELQSWLSKYADHPDSKLIYNIARKRGNHRYLVYPKLAPPPKTNNGYSGWLVGGYYSPKARQIFRKFRRSMARGWTKAAKRILQKPSTKKALTKKDYDMLSGYLGFRYFVDLRDEWAYKWSKDAALRSKNPIALWTAGLSSWKLKKYEQSAHFFELLAKDENTSSWLVSAGAYWAFRANIKASHFQKATKWLNIASNYPKTFYGFIANRALGKDIKFTWLSHDEEHLNDKVVEQIYNTNEGKRAFALLQIGKPHKAEKELISLFNAKDDKIRRSLLMLAEGLKMPSLSYKTAKYFGTKDKGLEHFSARFPIPNWQPKGGWELDKALIYAFIRQESCFNSYAKSTAGARGLMQLMPSTAAFVAKNRRLRWNRISLLNPEYNLYLGQKYLSLLMRDNRIKNNLFYLIASYNGGPGNLIKWKRRLKKQTDPLMFIERLPARETRIYVERVMTNYWVYRLKMNQKTPTLDALTQGKWPIYKSQDKLIKTKFAKD